MLAWKKPSISSGIYIIENVSAKISKIENLIFTVYQKDKCLKFISTDILTAKVFIAVSKRSHSRKLYDIS